MRVITRDVSRYFVEKGFSYELLVITFRWFHLKINEFEISEQNRISSLLIL